MAATFTPDSLPQAVRTLFSLNNFDVDGPLQINGAEVDLRARHRSNPFGEPIYIEVTVEYVTNEKYGKDATKFLLIREKEPSAKLLIVSSQGFSLPVKERGTESRIELLTYDDLFSRFQQFGPFVSTILSEGILADELKQLDSFYEEPLFSDSLGIDKATEFLTQWRDEHDPAKKWLIIIGEYGTGKTALTKVLLRRWMQHYQENPLLPIPIRIELRDFTRQFDMKGLLHHFLDSNGLSHLSVDFLLSLIQSGRVVLLLDGYDEMAQYMLARERRVCLEALAQLALGGVRGILTSRPNYFIEAEEFQVFEILYASIENMHYMLKNSSEILEAERAIDSLLESQFITKYERSLQDLSPTQTEALVKRVLAHDSVACEVVIEILRKVFRNFDADASRSLSGKPVIITYLLEIAEELKNSDRRNNDDTLSEWQVYALIVDKLMLRDLRRAPDLPPQQRLSFLRNLSIWLSKKNNPVITEDDFITLIRKEFDSVLRRRTPDEHEEQLQRLFADLRSSTTLTRSTDGKRAGWRFSHNSLREFLAADYMLAKLKDTALSNEVIPVTDAMKIFSASLPAIEKQNYLHILNQNWPSRGNREGQSHGQVFCLLWEAFLSLFRTASDPSRETIINVTGTGLNCDGIILERIMISSPGKPTNLQRANFSQSILTDVNFSAGNYEGANFSDSILDGVNFTDANLQKSNFFKCTLSDVDISGADIIKADFREIDLQSRILYGGKIYEGRAVNGLLAYLGAVTNKVLTIDKYQHHPLFEIAEKIGIKMVEGRIRQLRGLTQRGKARDNPAFARSFIQLLIKEKFAEIPLGRVEQVAITAVGRTVLDNLIGRRELHPVFEEFFENYS